MAQCSFERGDYKCENEAHEHGEGLCALHCKKSTDYHTDWRSGLLRDFYNELLDYLVSQLQENRKPFSFDVKDALENFYDEDSYVEGASGNVPGISGNEEYRNFPKYLKNEQAFFRHISFPKYDDRDSFSYPRLISTFGKVWFQFCSFVSSESGFNVSYFDRETLNDSSVFYDECEFFSDWNIDQLPMLENDPGAMHSLCRFYGVVNQPTRRNVEFVGQRPVILDNVFINCEFSGPVVFENASFRKSIFIDENKLPFFSTVARNRRNYHDGNSLLLSGCDFESGAFFNDVFLDGLASVKFENCKFSGKFELKSQALNNLDIVNCNFDKVSDFYGLKVNNFLLERCIFNDFAGFENTVIGIEKQADGRPSSIFKYVTMKSFVTFRGAKFVNGLDFKNTNLLINPNFLGVEIAFEGTPRETFRIVKHSLDQVGNHLEANKFFAKEMDKYREEIKAEKNIPTWDRVVYYFNKFTSDFGQNYLLGVGWLLLSTILYFYIFVVHRHFGWLHSEPSCSVFDNWYDKVNCAASGIIPFKGFLTNGMEIFSVVFYVIFAVLIWQVIVALKRHTVR